MSTTELRRAGVLARVAAGTLQLGSAAALMEVSYRQAKRLYRRYRDQGAAGVTHRSAGRASNRGRATKVRDRVLRLIRVKYGGGVEERFGPTLAAEHLASEDGITVDHETLRRWMLAAGLWSRARKRSPHRRRRERKAHFGELVQLDGSFHDWFEGRGPHSCLLTLVDDATGRTQGGVSAQETICAAAAVLRGWITTYGLPHALYTDWKNVYVRPPTEEERLTDTEPLTQFGRMCAELGIRIIPASSPQAKGRIERNHGTHQDRLVKKLRRRSIGDMTAANAFLEAEYWAAHNARFAQSPASPDDFHVAMPRGVRLDAVFRLEQTRTVSNDWVVRYDNRFFQVERQSHRPPARSTVLVYEGADGQIEIRYRGRDALHGDPAGGGGHQGGLFHPRARAARFSGRRRFASGRGPAPIIRGAADSRSARGAVPTRRRRRDEEPVEAAGAVDAQNAPTAPWKTTDQFSTAPTGILVLFWKGTFLSS